jgi:hypothetical protein
MESEIDWKKVSEYQQALDDSEKRRRERVKIFNPKEVLVAASRIREIEDEDLGLIRYVVLSFDKLNEITTKFQDNRERSIYILYAQLAPANPDLTVEDIKNMPYEVVAKLLLILQGRGSFLPRTSLPKLAKSLSGLTSTGEPSE